MGEERFVKFFYLKNQFLFCMLRTVILQRLLDTYSKFEHYHNFIMSLPANAKKGRKNWIQDFQMYFVVYYTANLKAGCTAFQYRL